MATITQDAAQHRKARRRRASLPYFYLLPAFLVMGVITFYPLVYQVIISFTDFQTKDLLLQLASPKLSWIGVQNYKDIITGGLPVQNFEFFRVLTYNIWWATTNVMVHVPAGVLEYNQEACSRGRNSAEHLSAYSPALFCNSSS